MTDINTSLEQTAAEIFVEDTLDELAADAPKKNAAAAMPMPKIDSGTPGGETQDMGPAVVSPDAPSDPGDQATKKAAQAKKPGRDGKGNPSAASAEVKSDKPLKAIGSPAKEEVEADEDESVITEVQEEEEQEETIEERVSAMDLSDDVNALTDGDGLSEEFKKKAATIFEAAIRMKLREEIERLDEKYEAKLASEIEEAKADMAEKVDDYLNYVVEEWMKLNEVALEHHLKTEIAEGFIVGLKALFEEHNISIPDEQFDMLDAAAEQVGELEGKLNEQMEANIELTKQNDEMTKDSILLDVASDLADTEVEKFAGLAEGVAYENAEDYKEKLSTLKESYFPKTPSSNNDDTAAPVEGNVEDMDVTDTMSAYMSAISRNHIREK